MSIRSRVAQYGLMFVFSYGIKQVRELIRRCQEDYNYDMPTMIRDARSGKIKVTSSLPARLTYQLMKLKIR
jgi:hypothetical protein